jgi:hypothetical protein
MRLDEITRMALEVSPQLVDPREASAIVESCGANDRLANGDFGMPHTFALRPRKAELNAISQNTLLFRGF